MGHLWRSGPLVESFDLSRTRDSSIDTKSRAAWPDATPGCPLRQIQEGIRSRRSLITNAADDLPKDVRSIRNAESVTRSFIRTAALPGHARFSHPRQFL